MTIQIQASENRPTLSLPFGKTANHPPQPPRSATLSNHEVRRIVLDLIG